MTNPFYVVMEGLANEGETFVGLFSTLDLAKRKVESMISSDKSYREYYNIIKTYPDGEAEDESIDFLEEVEMSCYGCNERPLLLVGSEEHTNWIDLHREQLKHGGVNCVRHTGRIVLV